MDFVDCESFLADILALCERSLDDLIDASSFLRGVMFLWSKRIVLLIIMILQFMWRNYFLFVWDLYPKNPADSSLYFRLALLHPVSYFFFLYQSPSSLCTGFDSIWSNIDKFLSTNPSANVFVFRDFNIRHKDYLTYSGWIDRPGELHCSFSVSNDYTLMVNFSTWIADWFSHACSFGFVSFFWR